MTLEMHEADLLRQCTLSPTPLMWFLGAGASRSSGLPTATDVTWDLKRRYYCARENQDLRVHDISNKAVMSRIQSYMDSQGFPALWDPAEYTFYFELLFGDDRAAQQRYVRMALADPRPSLTVGHRALSSLMKLGRCRAVFTTNFDDVVERAYAELHRENLVAFHLEGSYAALDALNADRFPLYVKLHGDFRYHSIKNLAADLARNDQKLQQSFLAAASRFGIVVSGYSGRDDNVMAMFRQAIAQNNAFPGGLFWTGPRLSDIGPRVRSLLEDAAALGICCGIAATGTFDEFLSKIWRNTPNRPRELDGKVRRAAGQPLAIPLPQRGCELPILRTNALRITRLPEGCGTLAFGSDVSPDDVRSKAFEQQVDCTFVFDDTLKFWGSRTSVEALLPPSDPRIGSCLEAAALLDQVTASGTMKAFVEDALAKAVTSGKPLKVRRLHRTWYAVVDHERVRDDSLLPLKQALGHNGSLANLVGRVQKLRDVHWAEAVSLRIEERNGALWLLLQPDIWIAPLTARAEATELMTKGFVVGTRSRTRF